MSDTSPPEDRDFSLVLGGPLYQMYRRAHLSGPTLELLKRRLVFMICITWLPALVLCSITGRLLGGPGLPFLHDIETHVRFLIVLPVLVFAELIVHQRMRPTIQLFLTRDIVSTEDIGEFHAAIKSAERMRDSIPVEIALLVLAFTLGQWIWTRELALETATWYALPIGSRLHFTLPGYWYAYVSVPTVQFILLRWYMRIAIWFRLLWRISRLNLRLIPIHPDRSGGIAFLGAGSYVFSPILFAQGAMLSGAIAARILFDGQKLATFRVTIFGFLVLMLLFFLGPLAFFTKKLARIRRQGLFDYGSLATNYVVDFDKKWLRGGAKGEAILGTGDIQSLADLANSYAVVQQMRVVPFSLNDALVLSFAAVAPLLPLILTVMPLEELLARIVQIIL